MVQLPFSQPLVVQLSKRIHHFITSNCKHKERKYGFDFRSVYVCPFFHAVSLPLWLELCRAPLFAFSVCLPFCQFALSVCLPLCQFASKFSEHCPWGSYKSGSASNINVRSGRETSIGYTHQHTASQGKDFSSYRIGLYTFSHLCIQCWSSHPDKAEFYSRLCISGSLPPHRL